MCVCVSAIWRLGSADFSRQPWARHRATRRRRAIINHPPRFCVRTRKGEIISLNIVTLRKFNSTTLRFIGMKKASLRRFSCRQVNLFSLANGWWKKPGCRHCKSKGNRYRRRRATTFCFLIFWVTTRIINLDYEGERLLRLRCEKGALSLRHMLRQPRAERKLKLLLASAAFAFQRHEQKWREIFHSASLILKQSDSEILWTFKPPQKPFGKFIIIKKWLKDGTKRCY